MANLKWDKNYWVKNPFNEIPELTPKRLNDLFQTATEMDRNYLKKTGIILMVMDNALVFYLNHFIYFKDGMGTFAISTEMRPNEYGRITYFQWKNGSWKKQKDVDAETE